ncbi:MAG: acetolactate decarboxylase [Clostridium sp.]|nr:acetolactate decarboxylase [Clostridium sp.]
MSEFYQVSTLNAIMLGNFDGTIDVKELLEHGNEGIGTFEGLDGEMIVLDGKAYNGKANGKAEEYDGEKRVAFATVAKFSENAKSYVLKNIDTIKQLKIKLNEIIDEKYKDINAFYILKAEVEANYVKVRSCCKQQKPYKTLLEVSKNQVEHEYKNLNGYLLAVWCPKYVDGLNMPGWHIHFLSKDKSKGGHMLEISVKNVDLKIEDKRDYKIILPSNEEFKNLDLGADLKKDTEKVEG